jgi:hypothetical protein
MKHKKLIKDGNWYMPKSGIKKDLRQALRNFCDSIF